MEVGKVKRVAGPLVQATGLKSSMYDLVLVGEEGLMSEVIGISGNKHIIQVYEDTGGVRPGEPVKETGAPLVAQLGPGILTQIYEVSRDHCQSWQRCLVISSAEAYSLTASTTRKSGSSSLL